MGNKIDPEEILADLGSAKDLAQLPPDQYKVVQEYLENKNKEEQKGDGPEDFEPTMIDDELHDYFKCIRCRKVFEYRREDGYPIECPSCGKPSNKTKFKGFTGPYKYFQANSRPTFIPKLLGEDIMQEHSFCTIKDTKTIYVYDEGVYKPEGEIIINSKAQKKLDYQSRNKRINETVGYIERHTYKSHNDFDNEQYLSLENGLLNVETLEFKEHTPEHLTTAKLPVSYDPDADCPKFKEFLSQVVYEEDQALLQELVGFCLLKDYRFKKCGILLGAGDNGKSTFLEIIRKYLLGGDNVSSVELQQLSNNRFAAHDLLGKIANFGSETPKKAFTDSALFKKLTGGDSVRIEQKRKAAFDFYNYATMIFACNSLPPTKDTTPAFWTRWAIIDFPYTFKEDDPERKTQEEIFEEICTPEEMSGVLNWALEGLHRLLDNNPFSSSKTQEEIKEQWIKKSNSMRAFAMEYIEKHHNHFVTKGDMYAAYSEFCHSMDETPKSKKKLGGDLPSLVPGIVGDYHPKVGTRQKESWKGLRFKEDSGFTKYNHVIDEEEAENEGQTTLVDTEEDGDDEEKTTSLNGLDREEFFDKICESSKMMKAAKRWLDQNTDTDGSTGERLGDVTDDQFTLLKQEVRE